MKDTILIVDDAPEQISILRLFLEEHEYEVIMAESARDAIQKAEHNKPELVLLDIIMPGIDGFEICRLLKAGAGTKNIPIIFMTARASIEDKVRGFQLGGADYITKPMQREEVLARINAHIKVRKLQRRLQSEVTISKRLREELEKKTTELETANGELKRLSSLDALTEVANRRQLDERLQQESRRAVREKTPLSLAMCDIDYFKPYNDAYGHPTGDECLRQVAKSIEGVVKRSTDLVARYGGEEFMVVFPNTDEEGARRVSEVIRKAVESLEITHEHSLIGQYITISIGIVTLLPGLDVAPKKLIDIADAALYEAKSEGRNRVVMKTLAPET